MTIKTKKVEGRRTVRYESYDELLADAERLATGEVRMLGNWSLGQNLKHIAMAFDAAIDGAGFMLPAPVRWLMSLLMKKKFLTKSISPGFASTARFTPEPTSTEEGLAVLRTAIARQNQEPTRALHPGFGRFTRQEHDDFNLRHAELHMSFAIAENRA